MVSLSTYINLKVITGLQISNCYFRDSLTPSRAWPSLDEMKTFRQKIRAVVDDMILHKLPLEDNSEINFSHPFWTILMGIEHEKIHLETNSCLIR